MADNAPAATVVVHGDDPDAAVITLASLAQIAPAARVVLAGPTEFLAVAGRRAHRIVGEHTHLCHGGPALPWVAVTPPANAVCRNLGMPDADHPVLMIAAGVALLDDPFAQIRGAKGIIAAKALYLHGVIGDDIHDACPRPTPADFNNGLIAARAGPMAHLGDQLPATPQSVDQLMRFTQKADLTAVLAPRDYFASYDPTLELIPIKHVARVAIHARPRLFDCRWMFDPGPRHALQRCLLTPTDPVRRAVRAHAREPALQSFLAQLDQAGNLAHANGHEGLRWFGDFLVNKRWAHA